MSIVCGTDFSEPSSKAVDAAARLAARMNMPLHVVHAIDQATADLGDPPRDSASLAAMRLLVEKERVAALGADVRVHACKGVPDEALLEVATREHATLIVVAALGQRAPGKWQLGSHADRVAQAADIPVLVVRSADCFEEWVAERRPLRIVMGIDFSLSSENAMRWVTSLCAFGPCDVSAIHLYWPPDQFNRLGLAGVRDYMGPHPEVAQTLQRQLSERLGRIVGTRTVRLLVLPHIGRIGDRIAKLAADENADLLVVGSHRRDPLQRVMEGSVSGGALHSARMSVACIPAEHHPSSRRPRPIANVLVATDFTDTGNAAIPLAYSMVAPGGSVHLVHVVPVHPGSKPTEPRDIFVSEADIASSDVHAAAARQLKELVVPGFSRHMTSQVHVLESDSPAEAIAQAAERLDSDLVCLGTHGRGGVSRALLGSVAHGVLQHTQRNVLFARKPKA